MKKMLLFIAAVAILVACSKETPNESPLDKYNGYDQFLKDGEVYKDLRIRGGVVGTVTYRLNFDDATFEVIYNTDEGWELVRTHMFAGKWKDKPKNRRNNRKRFRFPQKTTHDPYVNTYTYSIPLVNLPPYEEPGFIVAAHAKVYNSAKCGDSDYKHAWADWDRRFRCSGWGGYSRYYYNEPYEPHTNYYSIEYEGGDLNVFIVDATDNVYDTIFTETGVGTPSTDDGASIDPVTGFIYFTNYTTNELFVNVMDEEDSDSYAIGTFVGTPSSITYNNNSIYYINETVNNNNDTVHEIREVTITEDSTTQVLSFSTDDDVILGIIPSTFTAINDIAVEPTETGQLYLIGEIGDGNTQLLVYNQEAQQLNNIVITYTSGDVVEISTNPQIAFDEAGDLYLVQGFIDGGGGVVSTISPETGQVTYVVENPVQCLPPFCDDNFGMLGTISIN